MNKEDEQTRLNIVTSLKELGEQVKELERTIHNDAGKDSKDGKMGNDFSKGVDSAVSIITGIITGDMTGGLAGASAPWLAEQIKLHTGHMGEDGKWQTDDIASNLIAHAILGAVVAELQGNSALSGGVGAVSGELASKAIINTLYGGKDASELTEDEKQTISALSQLASGLAVAAGGGNIGDASAAINSSKNAVENNYLSKKQMHDYVDELQQCGNSTQCAIDVQKKYDEMDEKQREELVDACSTNPYSSDCFNHIKNAVEGGIVLFTEADITNLLGEMGQYSLTEVCQGAPSNCSEILAQQDAKNQKDADFNISNPVLIAERAKDARYILSYLGMDTSSMTDKEAVDKVNEIGLITSAGIMGAGKGERIRERQHYRKGKSSKTTGIRSNLCK